ncbi:unnamed protein product [marine sediment metagenome]|uniref:Uncharacterized protein n=1 Tax=marine sediment metagenome TaxID=412755 RepID=X1EB15_9ZZZZ
MFIMKLLNGYNNLNDCMFNNHGDNNILDGNNNNLIKGEKKI